MFFCAFFSIFAHSTNFHSLFDLFNYAKKNPHSTGSDHDGHDHAVVSRCERYAAPLPGLDSPYPVLASLAGSQRGGYRCAGVAHAHFWAHLLLGHLTAGHFPGHRVVDTRQVQEKPLYSQWRETLATIWCAGTVCHCLHRRYPLIGGSVGAL